MEKHTSLTKAFRLLEALAQGRALGVTDLVEATGIPASTVHRILATLTQLGYARQDPDTRLYALGLKLLSLTAGLRDSLDLSGLARPVMRELVRQSGETVNLVIFQGDHAVYVDQASNPRSLLRMFTKVGATAPLYCSGVGKVYLADLPPARLAAYLERVELAALTPHTLTDPGELTRELAQVAARGYARDREEIETGVACVAAPVRQDGQVVAGLSISGPSARINDQTAPELGRLVAAAAGEIAARLALGDGGLEPDTAPPLAARF